MGSLAVEFLDASTTCEEFPGENMLSGDPRSHGWRSAENCDYPQEIILRVAEGVARVETLEIVGHECMIPRQIDIYTTK
ncbi:hypothetical protein KIPB_004736, partial [Kipferlia bialata]|eukprot:g4736.t1